MVLQKILQITGWAKENKVDPVFIELIEKLLNRQRFCGFIMSKAFKQAQKILEDKGREISQEDVEVFTMLTALFDEDEAADLEKLFEVIEQIKIGPIHQTT